MDIVPLSTQTLLDLARQDPCLKRVFGGVYASDELPKPRGQKALILNTDPQSESGKHWLGLWWENQVCEIMDSYGLPVSMYEARDLQAWIAKKTLIGNNQPIQAMNCAACGHYALLYLKAKARGLSLQDFLEQFSSHVFVSSDHKIGLLLENIVVRPGCHICQNKKV